MRTERGVRVRYTKKAFEGLTETAIAGDKVGIFIYLDKPIVYLIEEPLVAETYRNFFEQLWKGAEP